MENNYFDITNEFSLLIQLNQTLPSFARDALKLQ
jgi:hypothetical protein